MESRSHSLLVVLWWDPGAVPLLTPDSGRENSCQRASGLRRNSVGLQHQDKLEDQRVQHLHQDYKPHTRCHPSATKVANHNWGPQRAKNIRNKTRGCPLEKSGNLLERVGLVLRLNLSVAQKRQHRRMPILASDLAQEQDPPLRRSIETCPALKRLRRRPKTSRRIHRITTCVLSIRT